MKRVLFVYNPVAGKGKVKSSLGDIVDCFMENGYLVTLCHTRELEKFYSLIDFEGDYFDRVVCSGGDGTLSMLISFFMKNNIHKPIGYIPAGSTNDYAYSVGISGDFMEATRLAVTGQPSPVDIGMLNEKYFLYVAAFGMFTKVTYSTPQEIKNVLGHTAYVLEGMKSLQDIMGYPLTIEIDGVEHKDNFILGMVTNSLSVGGFHKILPKDSMMDDGQFEMIFIRELKKPLALTETIAALLNDRLDSCPHILYAKSSRVRVIFDEEIDWIVDGEYGGSHREVEIKNLKQKQSIICE